MSVRFMLLMALMLFVGILIGAFASDSEVLSKRNADAISSAETGGSAHEALATAKDENAPGSQRLSRTPRRN